MPTRPSPASRTDGVRNRAAVLAAATRELEAGREITVAAVAAAAGVARPTVYRHFPDREALLDAVALDAGAGVAEPLLADLDALSLSAGLAHLAAHVVGHGRRHRQLLRAVAGRVDTLSRDVVDDDPLRALLASRRARGEVDSPHDDAWLASCVRAVCLTAMLDERPAATVRADLTRTLHRLLDLDQPAEPHGLPG